jgi:hypothetical protein
MNTHTHRNGNESSTQRATRPPYNNPLIFINDKRVFQPPKSGEVDVTSSLEEWDAKFPDKAKLQIERPGDGTILATLKSR